MQEVDRYGWETVRRLELTLFQQIESSEMTWPLTGGMEWFQTKMGLYGAIGPLPSNAGPSEHDIVKKAKINPCPAFQLDTCPKPKDHDGFKHICAYHYNILGGKHHYPHGEVNSKLKTSHTEAALGPASVGNPQ